VIKKQALYEQVADLVRQRIYDGQLIPGEAIDERALCELYEISRTPLREALKVLSREGLVELKPNRGCFVRNVEMAELAELFPVMSVLEGLAARQAAENLTDQDLAELEQMHEELERRAQSGDITAYYEANSAFHMKVQALSDNRWLQRVGSELRQVLKLARHSQLTIPGRLSASLQEHREILGAFRQRDAAGADRLMQTHLMAQWRILEQQADRNPGARQRSSA